MFLTVGSVVNLLSHVSTLVMGGGDPAIYLNKILPTTEVVRLLIGESSASVFQQQQFKMLLSGGGEGGGIASPIAPRGSGGRSGEYQLPRGSKQSMPDSVDEQSSVPHLPKTPSKRIRSSSPEEVAAPQSFKKPRLSPQPLNLGQESSEEPEGGALQSGKSNIVHESSGGGGSPHISAGKGKGGASSEQASQEVQETPSFDDLLTQAIQAVSGQDFSPAKESVKTQVQSQPSGLTPTIEERTAAVNPSATESKPQAVPSVTKESMETETVSDLAAESIRQAAPSVPAASMETETVNDLAAESIPQPSSSVITAATERKVVSYESTLQIVPSLTTVLTEIETTRPSTTELTSRPAPSMTTVLTEIETVSASATKSTTQSPSASADPALQQQRRNLFDELNRQVNRRQANSKEKKQKSQEAKPNPSVSADPALQQQRRSLFDEMKGFRLNKGQQRKGQTTQKSEDMKPGHSASADSASQQQRMSLSEELNSRFKKRKAKSSQSKQKSEGMKPDSSTSADPALQQQGRSLFDEMKGFQFKKGPQKKGQTTQKSEGRKPNHSASADSARPQKKMDLFSELSHRLNQIQSNSEEGSTPALSLFGAKDSSLNESTHKSHSLDRFGLRRTSRFDELVHGTLPVREQKSTSAPTLTPQKPVGMNRFALGKKSPLARAQQESISDRINKLELERKKKVENIEWQKAYNPKFNSAVSLRELKVIEGKISEFKIQMARESKRVNSIGRGVASSHPTIPVAQNLFPEIKNNSADQSIASPSSSISTPQDDSLAGIQGSSTDQGIASSLASTSTSQDDLFAGIQSSSTNQGAASSLPSFLISTSLDALLAGVEGGVELRPTSGPVKQEVQKTDLEKSRDSKLEARRRAMHSADDDDDNGIDLRFIGKSQDTPPVSTPVKTPPKPISADISPAKRGRLAMLGKASPQAASAPSLLEQIRAGRKQSKVSSASTVAVSPNPEEKKEEGFLTRTLSSAADLFFGKRGFDSSAENAETEPKARLPLGSSDGWGADDDEWDD